MWVKGKKSLRCRISYDMIIGRWKDKGYESEWIFFGEGERKRGREAVGL